MAFPLQTQFWADAEVVEPSAGAGGQRVALPGRPSLPPSSAPHSHCPRGAGPLRRLPGGPVVPTAVVCSQQQARSQVQCLTVPPKAQTHPPHSSPVAPARHVRCVLRFGNGAAAEGSPPAERARVSGGTAVPRSRPGHGGGLGVPALVPRPVDAPLRAGVPRCLPHSSEGPPRPCLRTPLPFLKGTDSAGRPPLAGFSVVQTNGALPETARRAPPAALRTRELEQ